jgi:4'-phosphopantetheinyl transferase
MPAISTQELAEGEVHVWHAYLAPFVVELPQLEELLSADERDRAHRFTRPSDRADFGVARALLRRLLEGYGVGRAGDICLNYSAEQKPSIGASHAAGWIEFNVSHSHGLAVYAFAHSRAVGIDVELVRPLRDADDIVAQQFATEEKAAYAALPPDQRLRGFFAAWTRKEAFLKAMGDGLGRPLNSFAVTLDPDERARLLRVDGDADAPDQWTLADWTLPPSYQVSIAVRGSKPPVFLQFPIANPGVDS